MSAKQIEVITNLNPPYQTLIESIVQATPRVVSGTERDSFKTFLSRYFSPTQIKDLDALNPEDLNGLALSHWQLLLTHKQNHPSLRVLNPSLAENAWQSPNTVIELVTEDQPHLVASIRSALLSQGHIIRLIIHPVLKVCRDDQGVCIGLDTASAQTNMTTDAYSMSLMHVQIAPVADENLDNIKTNILNTLEVLDVVRNDSSAMLQRLAELSDQCVDAEQTAFFKWLSEKQFSCFGTADIVVDQKLVTTTAPLGLFSDFNTGLQWHTETLIPEDALASLHKIENGVIICKANARSPILRTDYADLILLLHRKSSGALTHISCVVGLFVTSLHAEAADSIPLVRERIGTAIDSSHFATESHDGKALSGILRGFPRDMLLQTSPATLLTMATRIISLHERQQIRLFHSTDPMGRFCNCLIYIPRDTYSRELRLDIESILTALIDGKITQFHTEFSSESALARLHFVVQKNPPLERGIDWENLESRIQHAAITWDNRLLESLQAEHPEPEALALYAQYNGAFPAAYKEDYSARVAVSDIAFMQNNVKPDRPVMSFYRHIVADFIRCYAHH